MAFSKVIFTHGPILDETKLFLLYYKYIFVMLNSSRSEVGIFILKFDDRSA